MLTDPSAHRAYVLGRLLERFTGWLANPSKQSVDAFKRAQVEQARNAGRGKKGKLASHNELIRRALAYDRDMAERGENWLGNAPRNHTLPDVLALLEDGNVLVELITGGGVEGRRLELTRVEVDREARRLDVTTAKGRESHIEFGTIADTIAKLKKKMR